MTEEGTEQVRFRYGSGMVSLLMFTLIFTLALHFYNLLVFAQCESLVERIGAEVIAIGVLDGDYRLVWTGTCSVTVR